MKKTSFLLCAFPSSATALFAQAGGHFLISADYAVFSFDRQPANVIAVRYANFSTAMFHRAGHETGFYL